MELSNHTEEYSVRTAIRL